MVAQFGWWHLLGASAIATAIAAIALGMSALPSSFDFGPGAASHHLTNPRHDPAAYHPASKVVVDPFYDETEIAEPHSGQH
jgi:hypothetical protein